MPFLVLTHRYKREEIIPRVYLESGLGLGQKGEEGKNKRKMGVSNLVEFFSSVSWVTSSRPLSSAAGRTGTSMLCTVEVESSGSKLCTSQHDKTTSQAGLALHHYATTLFNTRRLRGPPLNIPCEGWLRFCFVSAFNPELDCFCFLREETCKAAFIDI